MNRIMIKLDNNSAVEVTDHTIYRLTPSVCRKLVENYMGQNYGTVTMSSVNPQNGEIWYTVYRVTPRSCRRTYNDFG